MAAIYQANRIMVDDIVLWILIRNCDLAKQFVFGKKDKNSWPLSQAIMALLLALKATIIHLFILKNSTYLIVCNHISLLNKLFVNHISV